jgi:putative sterol carrier protein
MRLPSRQFPPHGSMKVTTVKEFFQLLPGKLDADAAEDIDAVYQFDLSGAQGGQYTVTVRQGACQVKEGTHEDPHVILSMAGEDCIKVLTGQLSGQMAAMSGRLKISGDLGLALQLRALFPGIG